MKNFKKNWMTSLGGVLILGCLALHLFGRITGEQLTVSIGVIGSAVAFVSKDGNKTGV